jgi:hypothetical protein
VPAVRVRVRLRVRASCHVHAIRPKSAPGRVPPPASTASTASTARASTPSDQDRHWLESPTGDLARHDRRASRPVVSPSYAQGSWYGTNRVVAGAPGRFAGPAAPLLSTEPGSPAPGTRPQPLGVLRSTNCARISEERDVRATPHACDPRMATDPRRWVARTGPVHRNCRPEAGMRAWLAIRRRRARPAPTPRGALSTSRSRVQSCDPRPGRRSARMSASAYSGGSPGAATAEVRWAAGAAMAPGAVNRAGAVARGCLRARASCYVPPPRRRPSRRRELGTAPRRRPDGASPPPRCGPRPQTAARRYNPGRCRTPSSS